MASTTPPSGRILETPAPGGRATFFVPEPPLSGLVSSIWLYETDELPHLKERVLPSGNMQLLINLREDELTVAEPDRDDRPDAFPGALLCGAHSEPFLIDTVHQSSIMGVTFRPAGAFPFLRPPANEFQNTHVSLDNVWGNGATELRERLLQAETKGDKLRILAEALLQRASGPLVRRPAVSYALRAFGRGVPAGTVREVTEQVGLSSRRFIQVFSKEVGLTPKLFSRVQRFQKALRLVRQTREVDWAEVAATVGYFDQSHLIHEFREFSGLSPNAYLPQRGPHLNHVAVPDKL
jgi:AraC-like DNA-binding protein